MKITGHYDLPAQREVIWTYILDPEVLKACLPGCSELTAEDDNTYLATVTTKVGPIRATFRGRVEITDMDPPGTLRLNGQGEGGIAGYARGHAVVHLVSGETPHTTGLDYDGEITLGGKIAQLGSRLIDSFARKLTTQFFDALADYVQARNAS